MDINLLENENFNINSESRDICSDESAINEIKISVFFFPK